MPSQIETLMNNISPRIYEENPFRILNLPVTVCIEEAEKKAQKLITAKKLNINLSDYHFFPIPGCSNKLDEYCIQGAIDTIRDSHKRLFYELFWFHFDSNGKNTKANSQVIDYLLKAEFDKAIDLWQSFTKDDDQHVALWAIHNLAVLYHSISIGNATTNKDFTPKHTECWQAALQNWHKIWSQERFWDYFKKRVFELDDIRLKAADDIETLRNKLPSILKINTVFALNFFRNGRQECGLKHLELIKESKYKNDYIEETLGEFTTFFRENIENICEDIENQLNDVDNNPRIASNLRVIYKDFFIKAESETKIIETFSTNMPISINRDKFAKTLRRIGNYHRYYLWDCKKAQEILNKALKYAGSDMLKETIKNDIKVAREDMIAKVRVGKDFNPAVCWFCGGELKTEDKTTNSITVKMHKVTDVKTVYTGYNAYQKQYTYFPLTITIPRCKNCNQYHRITTPWMYLGFLGIFIYVIGALPLVAIGYIIGHFIAANKNKAIRYDIYTLAIPLIVILGTPSIFFGFWSNVFMLVSGYMLYSFMASKMKKGKNRISIYSLVLIATLGLVNTVHFGARILLPLLIGAITGHFVVLRRKKRSKKSENVAVIPRPYLYFRLYPLYKAAQVNGYVIGEKPTTVS